MASEQELGEQVRQNMLAMLLQFSPVHQLKVSDVLQIAGMAQFLALEALKADEK